MYDQYQTEERQNPNRQKISTHYQALSEESYPAKLYATSLR